MSKALWFVGGGVVIVGGLWWFLDRPTAPSESMMEQDVMSKETESMAPKDESMQQETTMKKTEDAAMMGTDKDTSAGMMEPKGAYAEYDPSILESSKNTRRVLFFYASWCPFCRPADAEFRDRMDEIPAGVMVIRVNYNDPWTDQNEKDLAAKYGVTYQHTFVQIDADGGAVTKWNGGKLAELTRNIR